MLPAERKQHILKYVLKKSRATIKELSMHFEVHEATIRRDLTEMEENNTIMRTHGGVILNEENIYSEPHFKMREDFFNEEKKRIGLKAATFIQNGDTIILDSGTTTSHIAEAIKNRENITVITNDIHIATLLHRTQLKVIITGGVLYPENFILNGEFTNQTLQHLNVNKAFIATPALHHDKGLTHFDEALVSAKIKMIEAAQEIYVATDHSKISKVSLYTFGKIHEIDYIITDSNINEHIKDEFQQRGRRIIIA